LHAADIPATAGASGRSLKSQMRHAGSLGADYVAIIGERELRDNAVTLKRLSDGEQEIVAMVDVAGRVT
jgi:histidyl-tRNA synthetase